MLQERKDFIGPSQRQWITFCEIIMAAETYNKDAEPSPEYKGRWFLFCLNHPPTTHWEHHLAQWVQ